MHVFLLLCLLLNPAYLAVRIDPDSSSYEMREKKRVDLFDFSGSFPNLENIDIDGRRKKRVEMDLSGEYPLLESVNYEGSFGSLIGKFTGSFPKLSVINFLCTSALMQFDLRGAWEQNCEINIRGTEANITLRLPENVGLVVNTKTSPTGKVINNSLKKIGWGFVKKTYYNDDGPNAPIVLTLNIEVTKGTITLE